MDIIHTVKAKKIIKTNRCLVTRVAITFQAAYHHVKDECGIKQKLTLNKKHKIK